LKEDSVGTLFARSYLTMRFWRCIWLFF